MGEASLTYRYNVNSVVILLFVSITDNLPALKNGVQWPAYFRESMKALPSIRYLYHATLRMRAHKTTIQWKTRRQVPPLPQW